MNKGYPLLFLIAVYLLYQILVDSSLGLYRFHEWHAVKSFYQNGLMTAREFTRERQTLAGHQLNLSEWNGLNEVIWDNQIAWNELSLKMQLQDKAYLWIFISQNETQRPRFLLI